MAVMTMQQQVNTPDPVEALWVLFQTQTASVRKAFTKRILEADVDAETIRQQIIVKQSLDRAFSELADAKKTGRKLPDARNLFKD